MDSVQQVSDTYIEEMAALDPISATSWGVSGYDHLLPDFSPEGLEERAGLQRRAVRLLAQAPQRSDADRIAAEVMAERLAASLESHDAGDDYRSLRVLFSPHGMVRQIFDLMRLES